MTTADRIPPVSVHDQPLAPLLSWATEASAAAGYRVTGPGTEMRRRAWTLLARLPTERGPIWAKAGARAFAHEGPLLAALDRLAPGSAPKPLAVHRDNGWFLTADGGETLRRDSAERNLLDSDGPVVRTDPSGWSTVLRSYALLQQRLSRHTEALRETGTPWLPPEALSTAYGRIEHRAPGLGRAVADAAAELATYGRLTLEHNDLYPGHVFASGTAIFDWGDAVVTHPFLSMRTLRDPQRAAYFDAWRAKGPVSDREIALAERLAPLVALHPFLSIDTSPGTPAARFAPFVEELLERLRAGFGA